jgi:hypothetical protein
MTSRYPINNKKISGDLLSLISTDYSECLQLARPPDNTLHRSTIPDGVKALKRPPRWIIE